MNDLDGTPSDASCPDDSRSSPPHSGRRRALLVAMPTILSLHQGVAAQVARTSSVLVWAETAQADAAGNLLCAQDPGAGTNPKGWNVDSYNTPIEVTEIPANRTYCRQTGTEPVTYAEVPASNLCSPTQLEGQYYAAPSGSDCTSGQLEQITPRPGALVSANALASFTTVIRTRLV